MKLKILSLLLVSFLILNKSNAQITLLFSDTSKVVMSKIVYKAIRTSTLKKDTIISNQDKIIALKDSIIKIDSLKEVNFKLELDQKNKTIYDLSKEYNKLDLEYKKEKSSLLTNFKLWLGLTGGLIFGVLITN